MGIHRLRGLAQFALAIGVLIICTAQIANADSDGRTIRWQMHALEATLPALGRYIGRSCDVASPRQAEQSFALLASGPPHQPQIE